MKHKKVLDDHSCAHIVSDQRRSNGHDRNRKLLRKAIVKPHRTVCSLGNYEEEGTTIIRDKFMEMLRREL